MKLEQRTTAILLVLVSPSWLWADPRSDFLDRLVRAEMLGTPPEARLFGSPKEMPELPGLPEGAPEARLERLRGADGDARRLLRAVPVGERGKLVELTAAAQRVVRRYPGTPELLSHLDWDGLALVAEYGDPACDGVAWLGPEYKLVLRTHGKRALAFLEDQIRPDPAGFRKSAWEAYRSDPEMFHLRHGIRVASRPTEIQPARDWHATRLAAWAILLGASITLSLQVYWLCRACLVSATTRGKASPTPTYFRE